MSTRRSLIDAYEAGKHRYTSFRKVPAIASNVGTWVDLSMAPGNPKPNYYIGDQLTTTSLSGINGLVHGGDVAPSVKYLHRMAIYSASATVVPATFLLCDYLLYVPLIDMDVTDEQPVIQSIALPRYTDGVGVRAVLVATNPYVGGVAATIRYTNQAGVSGRNSIPSVLNTATFIATILSSNVANAMGPFLALAPGDTGIRSVEGITFTAPAGGLASLVLVRPLATITLTEINAWIEVEFTRERTLGPRIYDGAYLGLLCGPTASVSGQAIIGDMTTFWE